MTYISSHNIVGVVVNVSGQSEVTNFHQSAICHQHVSSCQVSVDALQRDRSDHQDLYLSHTTCYPQRAGP